MYFVRTAENAESGFCKKYACTNLTERMNVLGTLSVFCWGGGCTEYGGCFCGRREMYFIHKGENMKKLKSTARVTELDTVSDVIVRLYKGDSAVSGDEYLKGVLDEIESLSEKITVAIKSDKTASNLDTADTKRDELIRTLGTLLNGYAVIPVAEKKAAAEKLLAVFGKYKGITGESYANESPLIESMLGDFASDSLAPSIKALEGVSSLLTDLRAAQDEFNKANDDFTAANASKGESATSLKKPLLSAINDRLVPYLTAMNLANKATYGDFSAKVEAEIEKVNASVMKRWKSAAVTETAEK